MAGASFKARTSARRKPVPVRRTPVNTALTSRIAPILRATRGPQAKLKVGASNDPAEREADVVAARAMSVAPDAPTQAARRSSNVISPLRRNAMDQPDLDALDVTPAVPDVAQDVELPESENVEIENLDSAELSELEAGAPDDASPSENEPSDSSETVQAKLDDKSIGPQGGDAPKNVEARIAAPGTGRPLPAGLRRDMEARFGTPFDDVRLHDTPAARDTAAAIGARAFAHGSAIWIGPNETPDDKKLMAHELAHVVQQTGRQSRLMPDTQKTPPSPEPKRRIDRFVGDAVLETIDGYAQNLPGYLLLSVLLSKNPVTGKTVERTAGKVIGGLLGLIPGGSVLVEQLGLARSMDDAFAWVISQLGVYRLTWSRVVETVAKAREAFSLRSPIESLRPVFKPLYDSIIGFATAVKDKVMEFIVSGALHKAGPFGAKVWGILKAAGATVLTIVLNPLNFAKNLILAVLKGFGLFLSNILKHLKKGLLGFLFGSLQGLDIELPEKLDLKGIFSLVTQILGLTWKSIRRVLVKRLGRKGEKIVSFLEKTVDIIKLLVTKGVMGIWQKVLGMIEGLKSTVIGGLIEFVTVSLAKAALGWLAGLSNPVGWIVKIVLIVYDFIVLFLERVQQIMELATSIFSSIAAIAAGKVDAAAKKVEDAIGRTIPLVLAFLAAIIPVTGIASKIRKIFNRLRKPVERAISKLVKFIVKKAKKLLAKIIGKLNRARKLPSGTFKIGKKTHKIFAKRQGKQLEVFVQSVTGTTVEKQAELKSAEKVFREKLTDRELKDILAFIHAFKTETDEVDDAGERVKPDSKKKPQTKDLAKLKKEIQEAEINLTKFGIILDGNPRIETEDPKFLLRFKEEVTGLEGQTGLYSELSDMKDAAKAKGGKKAEDDLRVVELDHNPNIGALKAVRDWLEGAAKGDDAEDRVHFQTAPSDDKADLEKSFGALTDHDPEKSGKAFPVMAIHGPVNNAMSGKDKERKKAMREFTDGKAISALPSVKAKLKEQMAEKSAEIDTAYGTEADALKENIKKGNRNIARVANNALNLSSTPSDAKEDLDTGATGLVRALGTSPQEAGKPDFLKHEGLFGFYSTVSSAGSSYKYLEADHNPTVRDMKTATKWTLTDIAGTSLTKALADHPKIAALPDPAVQQAVRGRLRAAMSKRLTTTNFTNKTGGAAVISARINQHTLMKAADTDGLAGALRNGKARFTPDLRTKMVESAITNTKSRKTSAGSAEAELARDKVRAGVVKGIRQMIRDRQEKTFDLYVSEEAPRVKAINAKDGKSDQAVGLLARIAARLKSGSSRSRLRSIAEGYF